MSLPNSSVETPSPSVTVLEDEASKQVIEVRLRSEGTGVFMRENTTELSPPASLSLCAP